jgi:hypothetical protein
MAGARNTAKGRDKSRQILRLSLQAFWAPNWFGAYSIPQKQKGRPGGWPRAAKAAFLRAALICELVGALASIILH